MGMVYVLISVILMLSLMYFFQKRRGSSNESLKEYMKLFGMGMIVSIPIVVIEIMVDNVAKLFIPEGTYRYIVFDAFIEAALIEEGFKYLVLKKYVFEKRSIDTRYDAMVYSSFVTLGFSFLESIIYIITESEASVGLTRALSSTPGHLAFSIFIGYYYFKYKKEQMNENRRLANAYKMKSIVIPVILHGLYDVLLMIGETPTILIWLVFVPVLFIITLRCIVKAYKDRELMYNYLSIEDKSYIYNV